MIVCLSLFYGNFKYMHQLLRIQEISILNQTKNPHNLHKKKQSKQISPQLCNYILIHEQSFKKYFQYVFFAVSWHNPNNKFMYFLSKQYKIQYIHYYRMRNQPKYKTPNTSDGKKQRIGSRDIRRGENITRGIQRKLQQPFQQQIQTPIISYEPTEDMIFSRKLQIDNSDNVQKIYDRKKRVSENRMIETAKDNVRKNYVVQRALSKQQSRDNSGFVKLSSRQLATGRPQTSKGYRKRASNICMDSNSHKKIVGNNDDDLIRIPAKSVRKNTHPHSATVRTTDKPAEIKFETSLDPQFLSLFAN